MHSVYSICFLEFQKIFSLPLVHLCIMNKNFISINTSVNFFHSSKCVSYFKDAYFLDNIYSWSSSKSPSLCSFFILSNHSHFILEITSWRELKLAPATPLTNHDEWWRHQLGQMRYVYIKSHKTFLKAA